MRIFLGKISVGGNLIGKAWIEYPIGEISLGWNLIGKVGRRIPIGKVLSSDFQQRSRTIKYHQWKFYGLDIPYDTRLIKFQPEKILEARIPFKLESEKKIIEG